MNTPRVFVVEPYDRVDVTPAREYGELVYLFAGAEGDRPSIWSDEFVPRFRARVEALGVSDADYFCPVGNMATVCRVMHLLGLLDIQPNLLLWNAAGQHYESFQGESGLCVTT